MKLVTMILTAILAASVLLFGCKLHQQEPVAQQKSIPRLLDELSPLSKNPAKIADSADEISKFMKFNPGFSGSDIDEIADAIITSGSKGIAEFKNARLHSRYEAFVDNNREIMRRVHAKIDNMSESTRIEYDKLMGLHTIGTKQLPAADFLKENTRIASDKIFVRLVKAQDVILDDIAEAIAVNHVIAEEVGANIARKLSINSEDTIAALKVGRGDLGFSPDDDDFLLAVSIVSDIKLSDKEMFIDLMLKNIGGLGRDTAYTIVAKHMDVPFERVYKYPDYTLSEKTREIANNPELLYKQFWQDKK